MEQSTIEMVTFKPKAGVSAEQLEATGPVVSAFLIDQPGFIYRSLSSDDDGLWYDIVYWRSMDEAMQAGEKFMQSEAGKAVMALIDRQSTQMRHMMARCETLYEAAN